MQVILPMAGIGSRMRPHTWSKPKPLLYIAGQTLLDHVLDRFLPLGVEELVLIVGWLADQIQEHVERWYDLPVRYVLQKELKGQAHAIYLAKEHLSGPCMISWVDTLFDADLSGLEETNADIVGYVMEIEDPRRFGVAVEREGRVVRLIEKPSTCEHRNAVIGLYYVRDSQALVDAIEQLMAQNIQTCGEFYLTDALQVMIDRGAYMVTRPATVWEDCGTPDAVLRTHRYLLDNGHERTAPVRGSLIVPPVHIAEGATVENAVLGPYVTLGAGAQVRDAVVRDAIIESGATIERSVIEHSLVGCRALVRGALGRLNVGDDAVVELGLEGAESSAS